MPSTLAVTVGLSLGRIRRSFFVCSLAISIGLLSQLLVWAAITFTDIRWEVSDLTEPAPLIVSDIVTTPANDTPIDPAQAIRATTSTQNRETPTAQASTESLDEVEELVLSRHDETLSSLVHLGGGIGQVGMIALLPMVLLSTLMAASTGIKGSERLIGVFNLCIILALLILPVGTILSLPWSGGALTSYAHMTAQVDVFRNEPASAFSPFVFYTRFLLLPLLCLVGTVLAHLRFSTCVEQAVIAGDVLHVDPELEKEAANLKLTGRGSRSASALDRLAGNSETMHKKVERVAGTTHQIPTASPTPPESPASAAPKEKMSKRII